MTQEFSIVHHKARKQPTPFVVSIPETQLSEFRTLLQLSRIPSPTYESIQEDERYGIARKWLSEAKEHWLHQFNWRKCEEHINSFPQFTLPIQEGKDTFTGSFLGPALISPRRNTNHVPTWLARIYTASTLPYHIIVPSSIGYGFSSPPPLDRDFSIENVASLMNGLMLDLGFGNGYAVQGGDIGSKVARYIAAKYEACKAIHLNFGIMPEPTGADSSSYTEREKVGLERAQAFKQTGSAYAIEHATFPSTIGFTASASPLSLLSWIGEKFLRWSDPRTTPGMDAILESVSLYWFTDSFSTSLYPYRQFFLPGKIGAHENPDWVIKKPFGFSWFPFEIVPVPRSWVETTGTLMWWREHDMGGHFAAVERPEVLLADLEDFLGEFWPNQ